MGAQEGAAHGFTVERAAEVIKNLPPEVPRLSAVRIVRGTLEAAGIDIAELESSTRARESRLNSEIDLSEGRIQQLKDETEEVIRNLEDEIRKAREARNFGVSEEERKIQAAETGLDNIDLVRDFFGLPQEERTARRLLRGEETQILDGVEEEEGDETRSSAVPAPLGLRGLLGAGDKKDREHPTPSGAPRPGFRLQPAGGRSLPREAGTRPRAQRGPPGAFEAAWRGASEEWRRAEERRMAEEGPREQKAGTRPRDRTSGWRSAAPTFAPLGYPANVLAAYNRLGLAPGALHGRGGQETQGTGQALPSRPFLRPREARQGGARHGGDQRRPRRHRTPRSPQTVGRSPAPIVLRAKVREIDVFLETEQLVLRRFTHADLEGLASTPQRP